MFSVDVLGDVWSDQSLVLKFQNFGMIILLVWNNEFIWSSSDLFHFMLRSCLIRSLGQSRISVTLDPGFANVLWKMLFSLVSLSTIRIEKTCWHQANCLWRCPLFFFKTIPRHVQISLRGWHYLFLEAICLWHCPLIPCWTALFLLLLLLLILIIL